MSRKLDCVRHNVIKNTRHNCSNYEDSRVPWVHIDFCINIFYRPQRSWAKVIFFTSVCQEFCPQGEGEGVCLSA